MDSSVINGYQESKARVGALLEAGELEESHRILTEFIENHGKSSTEIERDSSDQKALADAYNTRGHIKYLWVEFDSAIEDYTAAIERDPHFAVAYYNRGQVHYRMGRYTLSEADLTRALDLKPGFTDAQLNLDQVRRDLASGHRFNT